MRYSGVGGQAVMEGIMMRNGEKYAVAVRKPDKEIDVQVFPCKDYVKNKKLACEYCGIKSLEYALPAETSQEELLNLIDKLNSNKTIYDGEVKNANGICYRVIDDIHKQVVPMNFPSEVIVLCERTKEDFKKIISGGDK